MKYLYKIDDRAKEGRFFVDIGDITTYYRWETKKLLLNPVNFILINSKGNGNNYLGKLKKAFRDLDE